MTAIFLLEIPARTAGSPSMKTLRVATFPGYNHPTAPGYYPPHLKQPGLVERHISSQGTVIGESEVSYGVNVIANMPGADGAGPYDEYFDYGYGDEATLLLGDSDEPYSSFVTVQIGKPQQPEGDERDITFRWRGRDTELDLPASQATYAGTNLQSPGGEVEGTPEDLQGQRKIRIFGKVLNVAADPVDSSQNIFGLNHDQDGDLAVISSIDGVRVNGSVWNAGSDRASLAALQSASPAQGDYDTSLASGLIKLGGTIGQGRVTVDVTENATASNNRVAGLLNRLLQDAGVDSGDIVTADVTQLESEAGYTAGVVVRNQNWRELIDLVRLSGAAWVAPNRLGKYNMQQIKAPAGTAAATFRRFEYPNVAGANDFAIRSIERLLPQDQNRGVPIWQVTVNYGRFWETQEGALASGLSEADKKKYATAFRSVTAEDAAVKDQFPLAGTLTVDTVLVNEADAQAIADHLLTLFGVRRDLYRLVARYDAPLAAAVDLGDVVEVFDPRFGLSAGKKFNVHGIQYNARKFEIKLELWG
jgi:hypothetical protein